MLPDAFACNFSHPPNKHEHVTPSIVKKLPDNSHGIGAPIFSLSLSSFSHSSLVAHFFIHPQTPKDSSFLLPSPPPPNHHLIFSLYRFQSPDLTCNLIVISDQEIFLNTWVSEFL